MSDPDINEQHEHAAQLWACGAHDRTTSPQTEYIGASVFFRHLPAFEECLDTARDINNQTRKPVTILSAAGANGEEAYSLGYLAVKRGYGDWLRIQTLDASAVFTQRARQGIYLRTVADFVGSSRRKSLFTAYGHRHVRVRNTFRRHVTVLPPQPLQSLQDSNVRSDITLSFFTLMYLEDEAFVKAVQGLAHITNHSLMMDHGCNRSRFNRLDGHILKRAGFEMIMDNPFWMIWRRIAPRPAP